MHRNSYETTPEAHLKRTMDKEYRKADRDAYKDTQYNRRPTHDAHAHTAYPTHTAYPAHTVYPTHTVHPSYIAHSRLDEPVLIISPSGYLISYPGVSMYPTPTPTPAPTPRYGYSSQTQTYPQTQSNPIVVPAYLAARGIRAAEPKPTPKSKSSWSQFL